MERLNDVGGGRNGKEYGRRKKTKMAAMASAARLLGMRRRGSVTGDSPLDGAADPSIDGASAGGDDGRSGSPMRRSTWVVRSAHGRRVMNQTLQPMALVLEMAREEDDNEIRI
ncbi:hypothetical protein Dimus_005321 [Dionaea muscipula]